MHAYLYMKLSKYAEKLCHSQRKDSIGRCNPIFEFPLPKSLNVVLLWLMSSLATILNVEVCLCASSSRSQILVPQAQKTYQVCLSKDRNSFLLVFDIFNSKGENGLLATLMVNIDFFFLPGGKSGLHFCLFFFFFPQQESLKVSS